MQPQPPPLPPGLPVPVDDGAAAHLPGMSVPRVALPSTAGGTADLAALARDGVVLYVFPRIGRPDAEDPPGWDAIPGARGCTQQSCAFRDLRDRFSGVGYSLAGLSAQPPEEQAEAAARLHLAFPLLADTGLALARELRLPTFEAAGMTLYRRLTIVAREGRIEKAFYPVFPPDENAEQVLAWIEERRPE